MIDTIMRLRKCAKELSRIADAMAEQMADASAIDQAELARSVGRDASRVVEVFLTYGETIPLEIARLDALCSRPEVPVVVGRNVDGSAVSFDLASMPHLLVGGAVGQGKTMFIHGLINGLISSRPPEEVRLILFNPRCEEFATYARIPHLAAPVLSENERMVSTLRWAVDEIEKRLKTFAYAGVCNIHDYNICGFEADELLNDAPETYPHIVIVMDEFADLMLSFGEEIVPEIQRLTMYGRDAGVHLVIMTRHLECDVVTGVLKADIPARIAFKTATSFDSRVLLDEIGAECLTGKGDCLYLDSKGVFHRVQVPFIANDEIAANVECAIARYSETENV